MAGPAGAHEPIVERYRGTDKKLYYRGDAAFASPDIYDWLEEKGILYAIRLKANAKLYEHIEHLLTRPVGRPPKKPLVFYHEFRYQAASWDRSRRVVAKVEWHRGELFARVGFIATNLSKNAKNVVRFYNRRGNCERFIKEGKHALSWTRLSCCRFASNQVRLALFVLAYNLAQLLQALRPAEGSVFLVAFEHPAQADKDRGQVISHARSAVFQPAEAAVSETLFTEMLARIHGLRYAPG